MIASRQTPSLSIVVPYRNRDDHLRVFLRHILGYFKNTDLDGSYEILIINQNNATEFNRGLLKNIGFALSSAQNVCFHDVDFLPLQADYSSCQGLCCLAWFGAEYILLDPARLTFITENLDDFFGGCVLVNRDDFLAANGYANDYWGWGFEDKDLVERFRAAGKNISRRLGRYQKIGHVNEGYMAAGAPSPAHIHNKNQFNSRWNGKIDRLYTENGLNNIKYKIDNKAKINNISYIKYFSISF